MARGSNDRIRKAGLITEMTPDQVQEFNKCRKDIIYFCKNYVKIQHPVRGSVNFVLYPYQEVMLRMYQANRYVIVLSARQTGKSITSAIYLLWYAMFHFDKTILISSNKNAGAMEMIHRIRFAYEELPYWLKPGVTDDGWNKHNISFENKSRIISTATSEDAGRGMAISLLFLDEFAFVQPNIQEEFWTSISPTLSTGGSCIMTSTPNGDSNLFAHMWRSAVCGNVIGNEDQNIGFKPLQVRWDEPPGRDERFKQEQITILGKTKWLQEYECEFISSDALLISSIILNELDKLTSDEFQKINDFHFWDQIRQGERYLVGVDPSTGSGSDFSVINVVHFPSMIQVAQYRSNTMSSPEVYKKLKWVINLMERVGCQCYFTVENNGVGEGILALYENDENPPAFAEFVSDSSGSRMGMNTNGRTKIASCVNFKEMVESGRLVMKSKTLITELKSYTRRKGSYEAQEGSTDDCISSMLLIVRILEEISSYEQDAFDKLYQYDENAYNDMEAYDENDPEAAPLGIVF